MNRITDSRLVRLQPDELSPAEGIKLWQSGANQYSNETTSTGIISALFDGVVSSLKLILLNLKTTAKEQQHYRSLESLSAALLFWGTDLEVSQGELDISLQHSLSLRDIVLAVLISIGETIIRGMTLLNLCFLLLNSMLAWNCSSSRQRSARRL